MSGIRTVFALAVVIMIVLLGVFYNDLRGYQKVERINQWVLYYCEECDQDESIYDGYVLLNGFTEMTVEDAIDSDYFDQETEQEIIDLIESRE